MTRFGNGEGKIVGAVFFSGLLNMNLRLERVFVQDAAYRFSYMHDARHVRAKLDQ